MGYFDNTAVVTTSCSACSSGSKMKSDMGMGGGMGTMMPIRSVLMGATRLPYDASRDGVMTVEKVTRDLANRKILGATEEAVRGAARLVQDAGDDAVGLVMSVARLPVDLTYRAENVVSMFRTMDMR